MDTETQSKEDLQIDLKKCDKKNSDGEMSSSTVSTFSSLPLSPVDSGVNVDSESELSAAAVSSGSEKNNVWNSGQYSDFTDLTKTSPPENTANLPETCSEFKNTNKILVENRVKDFTESDFLNKNVFDKELLDPSTNYFDVSDSGKSKTSVGQIESPKYWSDDVFEMEHPLKSANDVDVMNLSLNSYELLDYTSENAKLQASALDAVDLHVSLSEEVNENLKIILDGQDIPPPITNDITTECVEKKPVEEQIVFRRQRKKKSKSDTPKKRVSFHEDILNSTKIDDIHINLGFITHEPDVSLSFFQRGFVRKPDVVKGRYSWAAEGDAPYYEQPYNRREVKSDICIRQPKNSSGSSSSTGSTSSSIDEEDSGSDENVPKKEPTLKQPKTSCLKKPKHKKYIDTNIVQEEVDIKKKKSESNLTDSTLFGSLKNILSFSTSLPLTERGIPEGQEDITFDLSSLDVSNRRSSFGNISFPNSTVKSVAEFNPEPMNKLQIAKTNFKLTRSEGFYPNYPNQEIPANIILCDSNVYEHKGISYSYEYDNFQKSSENKKPKPSVLYQKIWKDFNIFRRKTKKPEVDSEEDFEIINDACNPTLDEVFTEEVNTSESDISTICLRNLRNELTASPAKLDRFGNEILTDLSQNRNSKHLDSPKRKIQRSNHYSVQSSFKAYPLDLSNGTELAKSWSNLRASSSKSSLINQFLKNVTLKKLLNLNLSSTLKRRGYLGLCPINANRIPINNKEIDAIIQEEIVFGKANRKVKDSVDMRVARNLKTQVFNDHMQQILRVFPVRSTYTSDGNCRPLLLILTSRCLYVVSSKQHSLFSTHFVLYYTDLNVILIGPNAQTIHFSNYDQDMQCSLTTGCSKITSEVISQLEYAMRTDINKPRLPAVKQLTMQDMFNLKAAVCKQTAVDKDEEYYYYGIVHVQDSVTEDQFVSLGPTKEGPLMFKSGELDSARWETAYFILKAGVLYMLSSLSQRVPMRIFPLINGACQGARRIYNSHRPHTFQLIVNGNSLLLAAPDEYVASEWLQELIHAASGVYNRRDTNTTQSCSLLMTSDHILTVREAFPSSVASLLPPNFKEESVKGPQALSCAAIADLVAFRLPSSEQSWCVLEFACREVHEYSGDLIIYFSTNCELETFISNLEMLWIYGTDNRESFPISTIPETDPLSIRCMDTYKSLIEEWPSHTVHLQFL